MTLITRLSNDVAESKWFILGTGAATLVSFYFDIESRFKNQAWNISLAFLFMLFCIAAVYSIRVRERLQAHQRSARLLHDINHTYRNALSAAFGCQGDDPIDPTSITNEREVVETVCNRVAEIYRELSFRPCVVTVKILTVDNGEFVCNTYARSEPRSRRDDNGGVGPYRVGTGENTAFDVAIQPGPGSVSHFYGGDLPLMKKKGKYRNRRDNYEKYYKCAIVVPIRSLDRSAGGEKYNTRGFLCVDTLSKNILNDGHHVELLAAFADQMYNFFSLTRGKYRLPPKIGRK
jgi:hypothetical protein